MQTTDRASVGERTKGHVVGAGGARTNRGAERKGIFEWDFEGQTKFNQRENVGSEKGMKK